MFKSTRSTILCIFQTLEFWHECGSASPSSVLYTVASRTSHCFETSIPLTWGRTDRFLTSVHSFPLRSAFQPTKRNCFSQFRFHFCAKGTFSSCDLVMVKINHDAKCLRQGSVFTARRIASAVLATAIPSVCPPVRHTTVLCQNDGTYSTMQFALSDSKMCLVL